MCVCVCVCVSVCVCVCMCVCVCVFVCVGGGTHTFACFYTETTVSWSLKWSLWTGSPVCTLRSCWVCYLCPLLTVQVTHILLHWVGQHFADFDTGDERMQQFLDTFEEYFKEEVRLYAHYSWDCSHSGCIVTEDMLLCIHIIHMQLCVCMQHVRFIRISHFSQFDRICEGLSCEFVNITIQTHNASTQIETLIPQNVCLSAKTQNFML